MTKLVRCSVCGHEAPWEEWPKGVDFFQMEYVRACLNPECDNRQNPGDASMRMMGGERPFVLVRPAPPVTGETRADAIIKTLNASREAS